MTTLLLSFISLFSFGFYLRVAASEWSTSKVPDFGEPITNISIATGREAVLQCTVENLGTFKVAWIKIDTQTLLTIHTHVITRDARIRVTHSNHRQWYLHIRDIQVEDQGYYMCQINTEPMVSQMGFIEVMVPPSILEDETSSDTVVDERSKVSLQCKAEGYPTPTISWRREDSREISIAQPGSTQKPGSVSKVEGEYLNLTQVMREDMGAYLCIASNGIPPSVSKRILLQVKFRPKIRVPNQLVGAAIGSHVVMECRLEASPKPLTSWIRGDGLILLNNPKYTLTEEEDWYRILMKVRIKELDEKDFGSYKCVAKNTLGEKEGYVRLYEIPPATSIPTASSPAYIPKPAKENLRNSSEILTGKKGFNFSPTNTLSEESLLQIAETGKRSSKMETRPAESNRARNLDDQKSKSSIIKSYQGLYTFFLSILFVIKSI